MNDSPIDADVLALIRDSIRSIWALELLLLLRGDRRREWLEADIIAELRGSHAIVHNSVRELTAAALVEVRRSGAVIFAPANLRLEGVVDRLSDYYSVAPAAIMKAIAAAPDDRIQIFADAFRIVRK